VTLLVPLLGGLAGSLHCIGMCGAFPLALGAGGGHRWRQVLYNLGRVNALVLIGGLSGAAGATLVATVPVAFVGRALAVIAGAFMIVVGLEMLGVLSGVSTRGAALVQHVVQRVLAGVIRSPSPVAPLALGMANAFLPCQLVYAFAARAAATASVGEGMLTMLLFGVGTVPAMLALGRTSALFTPRARARLSLASGALVVAFGILTLLRAGPSDFHLHPGHAF
jgi:sulfite exporter TauE/SafE